jgi:hypothetical protein
MLSEKVLSLLTVLFDLNVVKLPLSFNITDKVSKDLPSCGLFSHRVVLSKLVYLINVFGGAKKCLLKVFQYSSSSSKGRNATCYKILRIFW